MSMQENTAGSAKTNGYTSDHVLLTRSQSLCMIIDTPKGRGVFAINKIAAGTVVETCPVLVLPPDENRNHIEKTTLYHYTYKWPLNSEPKPLSQDTHTQAIVFGLGSLFNHAARGQNVGWQRDTERQVIIYRALRDIEAGEELCISYGSRLTFVDADADSQSGDEAAEDVLGRIDIAND